MRCNARTYVQVTWWRISERTMKLRISAKQVRFAFVLSFMWRLAPSAAPGIKNMALVVSAGSKLSDVRLGDLTRFCKGTQKAWPDGKNFTLVMKDPESPELRVVEQKVLGAAPADLKTAIPKLTESRLIVRIVEHDEDLIRTV